MTGFNAKSPRPSRRPLTVHTGAGLAIGLVAAMSAVHAGTPTSAALVPGLMAQVAPATSSDPGKQLPGTISVSNIDFKRGDGGAGRLTVRFRGGGGMPDLRSPGSTVVIDFG